MSAAAVVTFDRICARPSMYGAPAQVESALWTCMHIWALERLPTDPPKNHVYDAVNTVRGQVPALNDRAGLSFHDLRTHRHDYAPVVTNMRIAFDLLKKQAG